MLSQTTSIYTSDNLENIIRESMLAVENPDTDLFSNLKQHQPEYGKAYDVPIAVRHLLVHGTNASNEREEINGKLLNSNSTDDKAYWNYRIAELNLFVDSLARLSTDLVVAHVWSVGGKCNSSPRLNIHAEWQCTVHYSNNNLVDIEIKDEQNVVTSVTQTKTLH